MFDEALDLFREVTGELVLGIEDLLVERLRVLILEGQMAADKAVEDDTCRPDVSLGTNILQALDELRRCITGRAASSH